MKLDYLEMAPWMLAAVFFASLLIAREFGRWIRARRFPNATENGVFATTSALGLLALLIGFTFSIALQRHETRRELVVREANALGTLWLRTDLLDGEPRDRVRKTLRAYLDARIAYGEAETRAAEVRMQATTSQLQSRLWSDVVAATASFRDTPRAASIVSVTNESIDLAGERFANREAHVPPRILRMLWLFSIVAAGLVGFERGSQRNSTTLLFFLLALAVALVLDLDRPTGGTTRVSQQPMLDLKTTLVD